MKNEFGRDVAELGVKGVDSVGKTFKRHWENLSGDDWSSLRDLLNTGNSTTYVAGQGVSLSCACWLAGRLRRRGIKAEASNCDAIPESVLTDDDVVILISRSGKTDNVLEAADRLKQKTPAPELIAVSKSGTPLAQSIERLIPLPPITESARVYPNKSLYVQMATLYTVLFEPNSDIETWNRRFHQIQALLNETLTYEIEGGTPTKVDVVPGSQFDEIVAALSDRNDLSMNLIVTGAEPFFDVAVEAAQKFSELLHKQTTYEHLGGLRDRQVNALYAKSSFIFIPLPRMSDTSTYEWCHRRLNVGSDSIDNLLKLTKDPVPNRLIATTFNDPSSPIERWVADSSFYGKTGLLTLDSYDEITDDLLIITAIYLFVLAMLNELWEKDRELQQIIIRECYERDII